MEHRREGRRCRPSPPPPLQGSCPPEACLGGCGPPQQPPLAPTHAREGWAPALDPAVCALRTPWRGGRREGTPQFSGGTAGDPEGSQSPLPLSHAPPPSSFANTSPPLERHPSARPGPRRAPLSATGHAGGGGDLRTGVSIGLGLSNGGGRGAIPPNGGEVAQSP